MREVTEIGQSQHAVFSGGSEKSMFTVRSGAVEVYACSPEGASTYHRIFLMLCLAGECFFSPAGADVPFELSVYALSDAVIEMQSISTAGLAETASFRQAASGWFHRLASLSWVRYQTGVNEDIFSRWDRRVLFERAVSDGGEAEEQAGLVFLQHQEMFATLIAERFAVLEEQYRSKLRRQAEHKEKAMLGAMNHLLKTEYRWLAEGVDSLDAMSDPVVFAVRRAAGRLETDVDPEKIALPPEVAKRLDPVTRMRRLVGKAGMQTRMVRLPEGWHKSDIGIILGYYGEEYELAALLPEGRSYLLVSVSHPYGVKIDDALAARIRKDAFMCYPCLPAQKLGVKDLFRFMAKHTSKSDIRAVWFISFIAGCLAIVMPLITESIFSDIIPINDRQALGTVAQVMLVSGLCTAVLGLVRGISCLRLKVRVGMYVESAMWARLLSLPLRFFRQHQTGDIINRMQGVSVITTLLEEHLLSIVFSMMFSFLSICLMLYYSVWLTAVAFVVWFVYILLVLPIYRRLGFFHQKKVEADNITTARTLQIMSGLTKFRLHGGEETAFRLWAQPFGNAWSWNLRMRWTLNYNELLVVIQPIILTMVVFYMTARSVSQGEALLGAAAFMGFHAAFTNFNATLSSFIGIVPALYSIIPHVNNFRPILEAVPEVTEDKLDAGVLSGEIVVRNLHFSYAPDSPVVLKGLNFRIEAGEAVAFVGPSGSGKSTLLRVLLGLEKPGQGAVFYDGQDFSELDPTSVRSQMGVVVQNGQLMGGEILTNIIGALPLTLDDAWEAAKMVGLDEDIRAMPMGMHTYVSEGGSNISGGQKQRILLARSLVNRPKIVVLDEATSALDNQTQAIVTDSIHNLGATRILVAHRLSTIRDVDRIFVLDDGRIAEEGSYAQLMAGNGLFAALVTRQVE